MPKITVTVNKSIYKRIERMTKMGGFKSPSHLVEWLIRYSYEDPRWDDV